MEVLNGSTKWKHQVVIGSIKYINYDNVFYDSI